jgi:arginase family enzyme
MKAPGACKRRPRASRSPAARGGISYREAHFLTEAVAALQTLDWLEIAQINPILDRENQTAILAGGRTDLEHAR